MQPFGNVSTKSSANVPEDQWTVTIEKLVEGGRGLAHQGSQVVFVRGVLPAETVALQVDQQRRDFLDASVTKILVASPDRVSPPCPVYDICGGCQLQHIRYEAQLHYKAAILLETLQRVGRLPITQVPAVIPSLQPYGYRTRVRFAVFCPEGKFALGLRKRASNAPVKASGCLLIPEAMRGLGAGIQERLSTQPRLPLRVDELELRRSVAFGSTLLCWHTGPAGIEQVEQFCRLFQDLPDVVGQVVTTRTGARWVFGQDWIADRLDDLIFRISDRSFVQANWRLNQTLVRTLTEWVEPTPEMRVLELYAGIGCLGLPLARRGALVTEVEANPHALADCRQAAKINHIGRTRFRHLLAEAALKGTKDGDYDVMLVDPPRPGLEPDCVTELARIEINRLFYLSCDAGTLARDLSRLSAAGYRMRRLQPFDMFPQTAHLEILVELTR
jgi:23S rRNA (uracil1939-C5)-methyltransferase